MKKIKSLEDSIVLVGVSINGTDPLNDDIALKRTQVSIRVQGTVTIQNTTGKKHCTLATSSVWEIPSSNKNNGSKHSAVHAREGINHNKVTVMLKKYDPDDARWSGLTGPKASAEIAKYTVGRALSYSKCNGTKKGGGLVDILLTN